MSWVDGLRERFRALFLRRATERKMEEEIRFHLEMETRKHVDTGMSPNAARRAATRAFGSCLYGSP